MTIDARQCPFCELKFAALWEVKAHLDSDHPGRITDKDSHVTVEEPDVEHPQPL
jgi:hypothetical protein